LQTENQDAEVAEPAVPSDFHSTMYFLQGNTIFSQSTEIQDQPDPLLMDTESAVEQPHYNDIIGNMPTAAHVYACPHHNISIPIFLADDAQGNGINAISGEIQDNNSIPIWLKATQSE
jgi:hypothetical protein